MGRCPDLVSDWVSLFDNNTTVFAAFYFYSIIMCIHIFACIVCVNAIVFRFNLLSAVSSLQTTPVYVFPVALENYGHFLYTHTGTLFRTKYS